MSLCGVQSPFSYQIQFTGDTTDIQAPSYQAPSAILLLQTLWENWRASLGSLSAGLSQREGPSVSAFECELMTWPALIWREKTKVRMNKTLLFCHVKWLEVILTFGFLPITEEFMNLQLCQENTTFFHCWLPSWCELHNFLLRRRLL